MLNPDATADWRTPEATARQQSGLVIAALAKIEIKDGAYLVPSQTNSRPTRYRVIPDGLFPTCNCPDHEAHGWKCKHIYAVEYYIQRERSDEEGTETVPESVALKQTRKTYPQNWPAYNKAQQNEKREFQSLLFDLCKGLPTPPQIGRGKRRLPMSDAVFSAVFKVYSLMSARRFTSDLCDAQAKGYIQKVPHFNSVLNYLEMPELFPILTDMILRASLPLRSVETTFAADSTGFAFSRFLRWYDIKYNRFSVKQQWVKAHLMTGVKTNVITAVEIHGPDAGDALYLPPMLETTAQNFSVKEVSADKGYSSRENHNALAKYGADAYIMFKANSTGGVGGLFEKMFHYFNLHREDFLAHYHQRSNIESTVMMIKTKFGDSVKSKTELAAKNEVLCKVLCHNICCLISAMYELGIQPITPHL